jgi:2,4-dienoyl-CoA reductase-like NADH-dependent reductase (Old Yellow Enzyme family)
MKLFDPFRIREIELKNRIVVSPMCQYSAKDGHPQTWHLVHLGSRAVSGASLVMAEATAVEARGRISPADTGIYEDSHIESWRPIAEFIRSQGALPGIQLAHAGRKVMASLSQMRLAGKQWEKLLRHSQRLRPGPWQWALRWWKFTPHTDTYCTNFYLRCATRERMSTAAHSRTECDLRCRSSKPYGRSGR